MPILVTGSSGLIGTALRASLERAGTEVRGLDLRASGNERGDIRDGDRLAAAIEGCSGVVHLAAVSRVIDGERDPERCRQTNVVALGGLIASLERAPVPPWLVFASSREVYGEATQLPVTEDAPQRPINVYGETKVRGEELVRAARVPSAILRLSNVYGGAGDHADRVVPAFVRAALTGGELRVEGADHAFDFTYLDDTIDAFVRAIARIESKLPPLHVLTGRPTTLGELAALAVELTGSGRISIAPPRTYDVCRFFGDPSRARDVLGWTATTHLRDGLARTIAASLGTHG